MALPWDSSTAYSFGAVVAYNGLDYFRSNFPATATTGTPPNEEMSTDDLGDPIRTWTISQSGPNPYTNADSFFCGYFRLIAPTYGTEQLEPDFEYYGASDYAVSAYGGGEEYDRGTTIEYDQEIDDSPACPADKCGVYMQQTQPGDVFCGVNYTNNLNPSTPRLYLAWIEFNHPLYFRRTITALVRIQQTITPPGLPPVITYINTPYTVTPTDNNYTQEGITKTATNYSFTFEVPEGSPGISYGVAEVLIKDVDSND